MADGRGGKGEGEADEGTIERRARGGEKRETRLDRSLAARRAKCGPCDSENWNVRTGAKPRRVSIRSHGFSFGSGCF